MTDATRIRLVQRSDGPVYLIGEGARIAALRATDLSDAAVHSQDLALAIAREYASNRGWSGRRSQIRRPQPLRSVDRAGSVRSATVRCIGSRSNDAPGTELYVSSTTGEVVLDTTRRERAWNYAGSVAHWIYPTALRSHPAAWSRLLWWLSLLALIGASAGAAIGMLRLGAGGSRFSSPYRGWQAWHHWLGLCCMLFVLTWIFSGWLSMDSGALFSTGKPAAAETVAISGTPAWNALPRDEIQHLSAALREVEWFAFGGRIYRRERTGIDRQRLFVCRCARRGGGYRARAFLRRMRSTPRSAISRATVTPRALSARKMTTQSHRIRRARRYFARSAAATGLTSTGRTAQLLEKLDASRRAYRWLYGALHTLDFPVLTARPALRTALIVALCGLGFVFSLTGVVIAWRRFLSCFRSP